MFWNEPNNKSHWAFEIDPEWRIFGEMVKRAARAVAAENPKLLRVLGGMSPIDADFVRNLQGRACSRRSTWSRVHGFPSRLESLADQRMAGQVAEIQAVTDCRSGSPKSAFHFWRRRGSGLRTSIAPPNCSSAACRAFTGTVSSICPKLGPRRRATRKRKAPRTIGISIWA